MFVSDAGLLLMRLFVVYGSWKSLKKILDHVDDLSLSEEKKKEKENAAMDAKAPAAKRGGRAKKKKTAGTDKDLAKKKNLTSLPRTSVEADELETWSGSKGNKYGIFFFHYL